MTVKALEISLNGEVLYTVGMEGWQFLSASIHGHRLTKEMAEQIVAHTEGVPTGYKAPEIESLLFSAHVGLPSPSGATSTTLGYGLEELSVGDIVTIRVIETDSPDLPEPAPPDVEGLICTVRASTGDDKK